MKVLAITSLLVLTASCVNAHGGLIDPEPRALRTMGLDIEDTFGWPIKMRGRATKGNVGNCLDFTKDKKLQALATGKSKIKMRANDGANHIGPCTAYLVDPRDKTKKLKVGDVKDCLRSLHPGPGSKGDKPIPAEMTINVPSDASKLPCDGDGHCVLEWALEATHITPHEFYNNCADVKINVSKDKDEVDNDDDPVQAPTKKPQPATPKPTSESKEATTKPTTKEPKATSKPSSDSKGEATTKPSSDSKGEATTKPSSDSKGEATTKPATPNELTAKPKPDASVATVAPAKDDTNSSTKKCKVAA